MIKRHVDSLHVNLALAALVIFTGTIVIMGAVIVAAFPWELSQRIDRGHDVSDAVEATGTLASAVSVTIPVALVVTTPLVGLVVWIALRPLRRLGESATRAMGRADEETS